MKKQYLLIILLFNTELVYAWNLPFVSDDNESANQLTAIEITNAQRYQVNKDATITDTITGLIWMRCAMGQTWDGQHCNGKSQAFNWYDAKQIKLDFAESKAWRLPHLNELRSLVYCSHGLPSFFSSGTKNDAKKIGCEGKQDIDFTSPTLMTHIFPNTENTWFWSSLRLVDDINRAWGVYFKYGYYDNYYHNTIKLVRLVRDPS